MGLGEAAQGKKTQDHIDEEGAVTRVTAAGSKARVAPFSLSDTGG